MLLLTDRADQSRSLERLLALWGHCTVMPLGEAAGTTSDVERLIVSDVDLSNRATVEALRSAMSRFRSFDTPHLCLLREYSTRAAIQANAVGSSAVLPADAPAAEILDTVSRLLREGREPDEAKARIENHFVAASAGLSDMLGAAADGRPLPVKAIEASVDSINRAADDLDLGAWLDMVWNHDDLTYQHCLLVAGLAAAFARRLGFAEADRKLLTAAALMHDIGKAQIPLEILHKAEKLTAAEFEIVKQHPTIGYTMLREQHGFAPDVIEATYSHHEYIDGSGYPRGLSGDAISDVVRMITICDIYAALIERRSYKPPMPPEAAYATLAAMGGKLDGALVHAFRQVVLGDRAPVAATG